MSIIPTSRGLVRITKVVHPSQAHNKGSVYSEEKTTQRSMIAPANYCTDVLTSPVLWGRISAQHLGLPNTHTYIRTYTHTRIYFKVYPVILTVWRLRCFSLQCFFADSCLLHKICVKGEVFSKPNFLSPWIGWDMSSAFLLKFQSQDCLSKELIMLGLNSLPFDCYCSSSCSIDSTRSHSWPFNKSLPLYELHD